MPLEPKERCARTWSGVREDERGPADPLDDFKNGVRVGGNKGSPGEGFRPVDLVGNGDEIATLVDSSLIGERVERPPLLRENDESCFNPDLGGFGVGHRAPQTDRHRMAGRGRRVTPPRKKRTRLRDTVWCCAARGSRERRLTRLLSCLD